MDKLWNNWSILIDNHITKLEENIEALSSFWAFLKKATLVSESKNVLDEIQNDYEKNMQEKDKHIKDIEEKKKQVSELMLTKNLQNMEKINGLEKTLSESEVEKKQSHILIESLQKDAKEKKLYLQELNIKQKLISKLLGTSSQNDGLLQFRTILNNDFLAFANDENSVANEAEMILKLQEIEKELELISSHPNLHSKHLVAVGGGFSSGKSEFISSFIESDIKLPIGVVPTTAIPSYVMHENTNRFIGCTNRGGIVDLEEVDNNFQARLSHEFIKSFGFNLKNIMPFMVLGTQIKYEDICFVDTPGYNPATTSDGFTGEDMHTASEFLDNANSLLWLIGADANGTIPASDLEFLSNLNLEEKKILIVYNKAD